MTAGLRPPPLAILQWLNGGMGMATYLLFSLGLGRWQEAHWSANAIAAAGAGAMAAYALAVAPGGRCADCFGRARTAILGCTIALIGTLIPLANAGPWAPVFGFVVMNLGCALFFPANAGLFSDAEGARPGMAAVALHRKVSRYNLGWSGGNLAGFAAALLCAAIAGHFTIDEYWAFVIPTAIMATMMAVLWRWRHLPAQPPPPVGDRAPHPNLHGLTVMGRASLLLACLFGMAVLVLGQRALEATPDPVISSRWLSLGYAFGYVTMFVILGRWEGWILRPWRLLTLQCGLVLAALGYIAMGQQVLPTIPVVIAACGIMQGLGYGAAYSGSIYYSLRLPHGASRAAGLHETALGLGSIAGPLLAGVLLVPLGGGMTGLGMWGLCVAVLVVAVQIVLICRLPRPTV